MISLFHSVAGQFPDLTHLTHLTPDDAPAVYAGRSHLVSLVSMAVDGGRDGGARVLKPGALDPTNPRSGALRRLAERHDG